jgi:phosphoribosylamine--glycine ligase
MGRNVLILGSGGREHALAWKLAQSPGVAVFATPGNPGIARVGTCIPAPGTAPADYLAIARSIDAALTVVGPEAPLVAGVVDAFRADGRAIVGPNAAAARLEGSKVFAKRFFVEHDIPTAGYVVAATPEEARSALDRFTFPLVLKADGLAAGKGVVIAHDRAEADAALATLKYPLVVEEFLTGEEVSFIALCDGKDVLPLAPTQDHKAVFDNDTGPNTGGMGAYCDSRILTADQTRDILDRVIYPTVAATGFTGFLYAGLMITASGPKVLEYNVRLGDPETQPLMHRMASDFYPALEAAAHGSLSGASLEWRPGPSLCVVLASAGYPGDYKTGIPITGVDDLPTDVVTLFHAGTRMAADRLVTAGGRVLGLTGYGMVLTDSIQHVYDALSAIYFDGMHYRRDIGRKGLKRYN